MHRCGGWASGRSVLARLCASLAAMVGAAASTARGDFSYANFASTSGLTLVGSAGPDQNVLRINPSAQFQSGAAWHQAKQSVADGFVSSFTFRVSALTGGGADGFAFVIQNSSVTSLGGNGCRNGYDGIANSIAVEFDTWLSSSCEAGNVNDPSDNHVSIHTRGTAANSAAEQYSIGASSAIPNLSDGGVHLAVIHYENGVLSVFIDNVTSPVVSVAIDLSATLSLDAGRAWVGFTGATGGSTEHHDVLAWSFDEGSGSSGPPYRPDPPVITEPVSDGKVLSAADVHMETGPFHDQDGDGHRCTDWEIWTVSPSARVWHATCQTDEALKVHIHLGDGVFEGSHAGQTSLKNSTSYSLRVRFRDASNDPATEYSHWSYRSFSTGGVSQLFGMQLQDVLFPPGVDWTGPSGEPVILPGGASPPSLTIGSGTGLTALRIAGADGSSNAVSDFAALGAHVLVRAVVAGGSTGVMLAASELSFVNEDCVRETIYLPAVTVPANLSRYYWVSTNGSTYVGAANQTTPVFDQLARGSAVPWGTFDPDLEIDRFATGFQLPVSIAMAGGAPIPGRPYLYVAELYGSIRTVMADGTWSTYASGLLNFNPTGQFPGSGEMGLASICREPVTGDLFATLIYANNGDTGQLYPRVVRLTSTDGGMTASQITSVLSMPGENMSASHQISSISIGPDGKLYVHVGDGFNTGTALNLNSFRGKILRMELSGAACSDNPLYNAGNGISATDYVFSYGHRNPFGGAWRLSDGRHFVVENGPSVDRFLAAARGTSYGWNGSDASMATGAIYLWNPAHAPVTLAVIQPQVFGASGFPALWHDSLIITESGPTWAQGPQANGKRLVRMRVNAAGALTEGPTTLVEYNGSGRGSAVAIAAGPDGLYFSDLYKDVDYSSPIDPGSSIFRVRHRPAADCNANGTDDRCDINLGTSVDEDGDGVPDECECVADFDGSGFIDTDDFDAFVVAFEAGAAGADVNGSGFVDTDDYDAFVVAYEAGC
ncbi:MAG: hypothetical protein GIKADHBN_02361 [Phycisphaerales bacterium]|nr:hypothetical protein [Phycisphaerales bacterium]